jgi:hypothetical protein
VPPLPQSQGIPKREKRKGKPKYRDTHDGCQFIGNYEMTCLGCCSWVVNLVKIMLVRGIGIGDSSAVLSISITKVLTVLKYPKGNHYDCLEETNCGRM